MKLTSLCFPSGASARTAISTPTALGRMTLVHLTSQSCALPGSAQRCLLPRPVGEASAIVGEDVLLGPAGDVEQGAGREEVEAGLRQFRALLAPEPLVELLLQGVQVADIACRIVALRVGKVVGAPVAGLLLLGQIVVQKLLHQVLEAVPVGVGADEPGSRAGAVERRRHDPEIGLHDSDIESGEVVELEAIGIAE